MKKVLLVCALVAVVVLAVGSIFASIYYIDNKKPNFLHSEVIYVYPETTSDQVLESLDTLVINSKSLARCFKKEDVASKMKPGRYVIDPEFTSIYVARMLNYGWQTPHNMTLSGTIRSKGVLARKISSQMMVDSATVASFLNSEDSLSRYGFTPENVFAMIVPDTYQMYWTASVSEIFDRMKKEYDAFWTPERLAKAADQKLSQMQVSIMASIVSGETLKEFEYPIIAGVYLNRYHKGMKLQADPTVAFCHGYTLNRILNVHLTIDSPYNTYKYVGLPPAPINVPPKACIDAVLNPQKHGYIFFCASPEFNGTHRFAVTYTEHLKNAREFQRELTARSKAKN